jgi:hypothetical protein
MKSNMPIKLRFIATEPEAVELAEQLSVQNAIPRFAQTRRRPTPTEVEVKVDFSPIEQALLDQAG